MRRMLAMALVAVALAVAVSAWAYLSGSRTVTAQARELASAIQAASLGNELTGNGPLASGDPAARAEAFLGQVHSWARKITLANAATGLALTALMLVGAALWQRQQPAMPFRKEPVRRLLDDPGVQQLHFELANHLKERRRLEAELTQLKTDFDKRVAQRTAAVSATYAKLEAELNQRKQSEKTLSQQRQELERSKDVLELHVQARTQQLQTLQRRYEHILNSAGEGIYGLDMTGKTTFVNPAAAKLTGYTVEELLGKTEHQTFLRGGSGETEQSSRRTQPASTSNTDIARSQTARPQAHPLSTGDTQSTSNALGNTQLSKLGSQLQAGFPHSGPHASGSGEQTFRRKDGSSIIVEYTRTPIIEHGKQMGAVVTFKDITERKRAEETLARKAAELARSNAELEQFAYVASHDLQEPLRKIRAFGDRLKATIDQLTAAQSPITNHQFPIEAGGASSASPATGNTTPGPHDIGRHASGRRKKSTGNTALVGRAAAPSGAASADAASAPPDSAPPEGAAAASGPAQAAKDYMQRMQNAAARMQTLINDLLTFSRVISTTQPFVPVDLGAVTREVLGDLELRIQQTGARIHVGDLPTIHADPMQMRQLLQNIIANALKFQPTRQNPESTIPNSESCILNSEFQTAPHVPIIHITAQLTDDPLAPVPTALGPRPSTLDSSMSAHTLVCELSIQDNGIGFDEKYTDKIFAMFQRLHGRSEYEGTGVGLAVCRRITDRHSGTITAHSKPGQGATFIIRLPVHQANKPVQRPESSADSARPEGPRPSTLDSRPASA